MIKKEIKQVPNPLENIASQDKNILIKHLEMEKTPYTVQTQDKKTKTLIALKVGIALDLKGCIINNMKATKRNSASTAEVMKAYSVARFSKSSPSISGFAISMEWLLKNQGEM